MSMIRPTTLSPPQLKPKPHLTISPFSRLSIRTHDQIVGFGSPPIKIQSLNPKPANNFLGFSSQRFGLMYSRKLRFCANVEGGQGENKSGGVDVAAEEARGESTMPERFRYLTKEALDSPVRWPWFVALAFLVYAWRAVLLELSNWRKAAFGVIHFVGYLLKLALALIFHFIGDPITSLIRCIETALYTVRSFYSGIVAYAPVPELTTIILLASAVLAIGEATVPNSINSQPLLLTLSGIIAFVAVKGYISEPLFWTLLLSLYAFSRLVKKKDNVSSAMPVAAVLAAIGEPWVRILVFASYLAQAISHHSRKLSKGKEEREVAATDRRLPAPLLCVALAIGIRVAAKWAGYRHLTWMIV